MPGGAGQFWVNQKIGKRLWKIVASRDRKTAGAGLALAFVLAVTGGFSLASQAQQDGAPVRTDAVRSEPLTQTVPVIGRLVAQQRGSVAARVGGVHAAGVGEQDEAVGVDEDRHLGGEEVVVA